MAADNTTLVKTVVCCSSSEPEQVESLKPYEFVENVTEFIDLLEQVIY